MNSNRKKILSTTIAICMVASMATPAFGSSSCPKDEVVYINLDYDGAVNDVYVVNSYVSDSQVAVVDYGDYTSVRNLSTIQKLSVENGTVNIDLPKGKFYYQGNMDTKEIPWIVNVQYKLDGKEIDGAELAGKSGHLEMLLSLKQNPNTNPIYKDNYALQASVSFDSEKCKNIVSEHATIANVGNNKSLSYIVLPDKEKDYTIEADVEEFEMDGISINGIPLSLDIDDPDTDDLMDDVYDLQDGAVELDDGAVKLDDAVAELCDGVIELHDGSDDLKDGVDDLYDATKELKDGADLMEDGFSQLSSNSKDLKVGIYETQSSCIDGLNSILLGLGLDKADIPSVSDESNPNTQELLKRGMLIEETFENVFELLTKTTSKTLSAAMVNGEMVEEKEENKEVPETVEVEDVPTTKEEAETEDTAKNDEIPKSAKSVDTEKEDAEKKPQEEPVNSDTQPENRSTTTVEKKPIESEPEEDEKEIVEEEEATVSAVPIPSNIKEQVENLHNVHKLSLGSLQYLAGTEKLGSNYDEMHNGIRKLKNGVKELYDGTNDLKDGVDTLFDGSVELKDGTVELTDGTFELRDETWDLDTRVDDEIDDMLDEYRNNEFDPVSFVSPKNTNIDSVQFVMKTEEITIEEEDAQEEEAPEEIGFWGRVKNLFSFLKKED